MRTCKKFFLKVIALIANYTPIKLLKFGANPAATAKSNYKFAIDNFTPVDSIFLSTSNSANKSWRSGGYNLDPETAKAKRVFESIFGDGTGKSTITRFLPTGTAANQMTYLPLVGPLHVIVASDISHLASREVGGVHAQTGGTSVKTLSSDLKGKITPASLKHYLSQEGRAHKTYNINRVVSISQPTELGAVYSRKEIKELADIAHQHNLLFQIDGARFFHAAAELGASLRSISTDCNVDMLYLGGSKNHMLHAEATIFLPHFFKMYAKILKNTLIKSSHDIEINLDWFESEVARLQKQRGWALSQSSSAPKQFIDAFKNNHGIKLAKAANDWAKKLGSSIAKIPGVSLHLTPESNNIFISAPQSTYSSMSKSGKYPGLKVFADPDPRNPNNLIFRVVTNAHLKEEDITELVEFIQDHSRPKKPL